MKIILSAIFLLFIVSARSQDFIVKDIKSFGAKGDGKTNDHNAFEIAADYFNKRGGNGKLTISKGTYILGKQTFTGGQKNSPAFTGENAMSFANVKNFTISGEAGSILKYMPGLRFGAFTPAGDVYDHGNKYFVNRAYMAQIGYCIFINNSKNVTISGVTMDGNSDNFILGGVYGDVGRQVPHTGIYIQNSKSIKIDNDYIHHFGLDGITVANVSGSTSDDISITNTTSEYNGRQGLSWVGGNGLYAKNCKFNHTGKGKLSSAPAAGVDIEAEALALKNGVFENCEFIDNSGCGLVADSGNSSDCTFTGCTFWGTTSWSIWVKKPRFTFNDCNIYGSVVHGFSAENFKDATNFTGCHFEDKLYNGNPPYGAYLIESNNVKRMSFTNCIFTTNTKKLYWLASPATYTSEEKYQMKNCQFIINNDNLPQSDFVAISSGVAAINCTYNFTNANAKAKRYNFGNANPVTNTGSSATKILYQGK